MAAWGWHSEVAIHVLRLVLSGALDRHPKLKLIIGHMGEGLAAMLVRSDKVLADDVNPTRSVGQTILDQVSITTSGLFTLPPFAVAVAVFGVDHVLFSIDYPYSTIGRAGISSMRSSCPPRNLKNCARECRSVAQAVVTTRRLLDNAPANRLDMFATA